MVESEQKNYFIQRIMDDLSLSAQQGMRMIIERMLGDGGHVKLERLIDGAGAA